MATDEYGFEVFDDEDIDEPLWNTYKEAAEKKIEEVKTVEKKPRQKRKVASPVTVYPDPNIKDVVLFGHQQAAFDRFKDQDDICLFFEMGCGKTITTLSIAKYKFEHGMIKGLLVVAPNDVHLQWYNDLLNPDPKAGKVFNIPIQCQCVGGRGGQKELWPFEFDDLFKFVSVNVDTFSQPHKWEEIVEWANSENIMIAIDEATSIKNPSSKRSQRLLYEFNDIQKRGKAIISSKKKHPVRAVLTGTPVTNGPIDLWAIMEFVHPNFFMRNYYSFKSHFGMYTQLAVSTGMGVRNVDVLLTEKTWLGIHECADYKEAYILFGCSEDTYMTIKHQDHFIGPYKHADELKQQLDKVAVFAKLTDCVDMPPVNYINREVGLSPAQEAAYKNMQKEMLVQYDGYQMTAANKMIVALRLQQISSGFIHGSKIQEMSEEDYMNMLDNMDQMDIVPDEVVWLGDTNPKLDALMRDVAEVDKPCIILTRYSAEAAKIYELCDKAGYNTCLITGWKNVGSIDEFKEGKYDIMVANSTKVHRGFNLQIAHVTLYYSNSFSMEIRQQSEFRTFRIGQTKPCLYIDYTACEVDRTINRSLALKKNLLEYIREKDISEVV